MNYPSDMKEKTDYSEKELRVKALFEEHAKDFKFLSIIGVNHKPHPYTLGPRHVKYASDNHMGMLGIETCKAIPCAVPKCQVSYDEHTCDHSIFISLKRNLTQGEANEQIQKVNEFVMQEKLADGYTFVDTPEKFRVI